MRVFMLTWEYPPRSVGGLAEHAYYLAKNLASDGIDTAVLTAGLPDSPPEEIEHGVSVYRVNSVQPKSPQFLPWVLQLNMELVSRAATTLLPLLCQQDKPRWFNSNRTRPIILHAHDWLVMFAARALKQMLKLPLLATIHATEAGRHGGVHTSEQKYIHDAEWSLTYEACRVICCSDFMKQQVSQTLAVPHDKIRVIPNGVDETALQPPADAIEYRRRYAADHEQIVFFIGRLVREKGVQYLLASARRVLSQNPHVRFVICGNGPYKEHLEQMTANLGLKDKVCFAGYVDDATRQALYSMADVAVFPSLYEPFGIVALEAMAAKTPVIVSSTGGLCETVTHGVDGLCIQPASSIAIAQAVNKVLSSAALRRRLVTSGQETARRFSWDKIAQATRIVYEETLADAGINGWMSMSCPVKDNTNVRKEMLR